MCSPQKGYLARIVTRRLEHRTGKFSETTQRPGDICAPFGVGRKVVSTGAGAARRREVFRFSFRLKRGCTNPQASYTNFESGVRRVFSGARFFVSQTENT